MRELTALHDQVVDAQLAGCSLNDLLFDAVCGDETINNDVTLLTNAVRSMDCLQIHLWVPVGVEQYNYICCV